MNVPRTIDNSCELRPTVSTLHIPVSNAFIPFQQFSLSDGATIRNPSDDNNNKTLPVVSVVATVTGLCPAMSLVSMHQPTQLAKTSTIIPTAMTPIAVQAANCLMPTTTMTVSNAVNISNRLSISTNHQQTLGNSGVNIGRQTGSIINNSINHNMITTSCPPAPQGIAGIISTAPGSAANSNKIPKSSSVAPNNIAAAKPSQPSNTSSSSKSSNSPKVSSTTSNQGSNSEQTDDLVKPVFKDGELVLEVECGQNKAILYLAKLCQGSKGPCINFQNSWLTPNEFQFVSGRETAKDWKRSIRHHGKSLKLLLAKGILNVHPTMCDCDGCRQGATLTRKGEKRRIPNGERKIKKPSNSASNCTEGSGVRSGTAPVVAAHLGAPGISQVKPELAAVKTELTPVRPEVKRPLGDMLKRSDVTTQSQLLENSPSSQRHNQCISTPAIQGANHLIASKDFPKDKVSSLNAVSNSQPSQTLINAASSAGVQLAFPPPAIMSSSTIISEFPPLTSSGVASHQTVTQMSSKTDVATSKTPKTIAVATPVSSQEASNATIESTTAGSTLSAPEQHHLTHNPALLQILSPNLPNAKETQTPTPTTCDFTELPDHSSDMGPHDSGLSGDEDDDDEDINVGNNTDASFNTDGNCDIPDEDSDDECPYSNKISEENDDDDDDSMCDAQSTEETSPEALVDKAEAPTEQTAYSNSFYSGLAVCQQKSVVDTREDIHKINYNVEDQEHLSELKKHSDSQDPGAFPKTSTPISNSGCVYESFRRTEAVSLQNECSAATTTLSISAISTAGSKPVSLSISTSNVKSEHLWIPPTLSSYSAWESKITHDAQQGCSGNSRSTPNSQTRQERLHHEERHIETSDKENVNQTTTQKTEHSVERGQSGYSHNCDPDMDLPYRDSHEDDRYGQTQKAKDPKSDVVRDKTNGSAQNKSTACRSESSNDKRNKERDRDDRHRLRQKEDKIRKEREERSKKDRERNERHDRERRDEKEAERLREEETERKIHSENKSAKDGSAASPISDPSRRPTGGVAEAAAFSDYMRFLAAGHGHSFMPPTPGYMCSFYPVQPQESALAPHLLHPLTSFSPQLSQLHKDSLLYQTSATALPNFGGQSFGHTPPVLHRPQYTNQQFILDYQRSLAAASSYPWTTTTYPYFFQASSASAAASSAAAAGNVAAGTKRSSAELEATMELNAKRMRLDGRFSDYSSPWDYFAAAADYQQHLRVPSMAPFLPCGLESTSMDKSTEYLRKRYLEYAPQTAMYLSALPEYARPAYQCACADHGGEDIRMWGVDDVCKFLSAIEGCGVYVEYFREQRVNGRILTMLTPDHLVSTMGMKLGSAVLLSEAVAKKIQEASKMSRCEACRSIALSLPIHPMVLPL